MSVVWYLNIAIIDNVACSNTVPELLCHDIDSAHHFAGVMCPSAHLLNDTTASNEEFCQYVYNSSII